MKLQSVFVTKRIMHAFLKCPAVSLNSMFFSCTQRLVAVNNYGGNCSVRSKREETSSCNAESGRDGLLM